MQLRMFIIFLNIFLSSIANANGLENFRAMIREKEQETQLNKRIEDFQEARKFETDDPDNYGGLLGRDFYKFYYEKIIAPSLSTYLTELAKESPKEQISIFHDLLKELGTLRRQISKTVAPWAKYFGNFVTSGLSSKDFVHPLSFPAWNTYLRHWITELIGTPLPSTCDDILIALTQIERDEFQTISKIKEQNFIAIVSPGSESKPTGGALKLSCEKSDKSALDNLVITFYHSPAQDNLEMIAPYFAEALSPNLADEPEKLLERLAELFFRANHLSIFERGQAAIIGWLVQGIANSWGYSLRYSDAWTGPNHPNPDQHALSHFSFAKFLEEFKKNVELKKL